MIALLTKWWFKYQRMFWYVGQSRSEISKPLGLYQEAALAILLLKSYGFEFTITSAIVCYAAGIIVFALVGVFLERTGVIAYNIRLSNRQNPELIEILKRVKTIENKTTRKKKNG